MVNHGRNRVSSPNEMEYNNRWTIGRISRTRRRNRKPRYVSVSILPPGAECRITVDYDRRLQPHRAFHALLLVMRLLFIGEHNLLDDK